MQILIQDIESGFLVFDCVFAVPFSLVIQMWIKRFGALLSVFQNSQQRRKVWQISTQLIDQM